MSTQPQPSVLAPASSSRSIDQLSLDPKHTSWLTTQEAAELLNIKPRTLLLWARQGKVRAYALCGKKRHTWRFYSDDLNTLLPQKKPVVSSAQPSVLAHERSL